MSNNQKGCFILSKNFISEPTKRITRRLLQVVTFLVLSFSHAQSYADVSESTVKALIERLEMLEARLAEYESVAAGSDRKTAAVAVSGVSDKSPISTKTAPQWVGIESGYAFEMLDHAESVTNKQEVLIDHINAGSFGSRLTLGGQVTALANYQTSNRDSKFGWLMRHPTSNNQIGETVSEAVVHSANLNLTASLGENWHAYVEMFYNPEQNFGANSTITGLPRNNVNVRRAYVLYNGTQKNNIYASIGKMDIPFGLNDTVSPFTNSASWHALAGLAYGATVGYLDDNWHARIMAIQGGAQFRNANAPVEGTSVPSKLNNFAVDIRRSFQLNNEGDLMLGLSYQHGSSYCQEWPIKHFEPCEDTNPAISLYSTLQVGDTEIIVDYGKTLDVWPGTLNPALPEFAAEEVAGLTVGVRQEFDFGYTNPVALSFEFSRFEAGPSGAEWERVSQFVLGASYYMNASINVFGELNRTEGWAPLNFLTGGNCSGPNPLCDQVGPAGVWAEKDATTNVLVFGVQAAF